MTQTTQPAPPSFRTIKLATIPMKQLSKLTKAMDTAKNVMPRIYDLLQYAQDQHFVATENFVDEAARVLGFDSRHDLRLWMKEHHYGIDVNDENGEVRIFEHVAPPVQQQAEPTPALKLVNNVRTCVVCAEVVEWDGAKQCYEHTRAEQYDHSVKLKSV